MSVLQIPLGSTFRLHGVEYMRTDLLRINLIGCVDMSTGRVVFIPEDILVDNVKSAKLQAYKDNRKTVADVVKETLDKLGIDSSAVCLQSCVGFRCPEDKADSDCEGCPYNKIWEKYI